MITITTTAENLAKAYFNGKTTGCIRAPEGITSEGREVRFINIAKGSHKVTLSGVIRGQKWEETYSQDQVRIDD